MSKEIKKLEIDQILNWFKSGEKQQSDWLIGTEHEKFLYNKSNFKRLKYNDKFGIKGLLEQIAIDKSWKPIMENDNIIGLKHLGGSSISLEPGGQFELSGAPLKNIHDTCKEAGTHLELMKDLSEKFNFIILGVGHDPKWPLSEISWMPKQRYEIMKNYMPKVGRYGLDMMIRTCTIQVNLDYSNEADMVKKFQVSLALQSVATALFANSPFVEGKLTKYLSKRSYIWTDTDPNRTGIPSNVFEGDFGYKSWVDYLMSVPMYFLYRDGKYFDVSGQSFSDFLLGKLKGFEGLYPTLKDWEDHTTIAFPEVRLKQYLEMRGADAGPWNRICALPALWVGLLYDKKSLDDSFNLAKTFMDNNTLNEARISAAKYGLRGKIKNFEIFEIASNMLDISYQGLKRRNFLDKKGISETQFLDPLFNIIERRKTPAEEMIASFDKKWAGNIDNIFDSNYF